MVIGKDCAMSYNKQFRLHQISALNSYMIRLSHYHK